MKKYLIITFIFLPLLSFGQLSPEEKNIIETYTNNICPCINNIINSLDPKVVDFVNLMADDGEEEAMKQIEEYITTHSEEEVKKLVTGFDKMSSPEFLNQIEKCDDKKVLSPEMTNSIDNVEGKYADYFYSLLKTSPVCKLTNYLLKLGNEKEDNKQ